MTNDLQKPNDGLLKRLTREAATHALSLYYLCVDHTVPAHARAAGVTALAYLVMPADVVPDVLPMVGLVDDAGVLAAAVVDLGCHLAPRHRHEARRALRRLLG